MPQLHILLIGDQNAGITASAQLLQVNHDLKITVIDAHEHLNVSIPRLYLVKETPVFYQPWNNRLATSEGTGFNYDYLILTPQSNNLAFLQQSVLSDKNGNINVNKTTLCHKRYNNIFVIDSTEEKDPGGKKLFDILNKLIKTSVKPIVKEFHPIHRFSIDFAA